MTDRRFRLEQLLTALGLAAAGLAVGVALAMREISNALADVAGLS